jgi:hypothetical protein
LTPGRAVHLLHIGYSEATAAAIAPGFELLDNRANPRPDWYELWPMAEWLRANPMDEGALYGFFSPKFRQKTGLGATEVCAFAAAHPQAEVCLFSPQPDVHMAFRSVFHGGEAFNPGYLAVAQTVLLHAGVNVDLAKVVMDSRVAVFSNYLVATPRFWRQWLAWVEVLIAQGEGPMRDALSAATSYGAGAQRKVFVGEGFASLLCWGGDYRVASISPFSVPWFSMLSRFRAQLVAMDALKRAWRDTGQGEYLLQFDALSAEVLTQVRRTLPSQT